MREKSANQNPGAATRERAGRARARRRAARLAIWLICFIWLALVSPALAQEKRSYVDLRREVDEKVRAQQWQAAAALWERIAQLNPHDGENWAQLAYTRHLAKDHRGAIAAYEKTIELGFGNPANAAFDTARCYAQLGEKERAIESLERALEMGLRERWRLRTENDLAPLRADVRFKRLAFDEETAGMGREEGWRYDLRFLAEELKRLHYALRASASHAEIDALVRKLDEEIPRLTDREIEAGMMKIMRLAGDGETSIWPRYMRREGKQAAPVHFYLFAEGLYIAAAAPEFKDLAGLEVTGVGERPAGEVLEALAAVTSRDNEMWLKQMGPNLLRYPQLLCAIGLVAKPDLLPLRVKDGEGVERRIELPLRGEDATERWATARNAAAAIPLHLKNRGANYSFEYLEKEKTVYFQLIAARDEPTDPFDKFCERLFKFVDENAVERFVIDLRSSEGGSMRFHEPLLAGLLRSEKINRRGRLFVIIGRGTHSAGTAAAAAIERYTKAIFVGEPTGSRPNFIGDPVRLTLPWSRLAVSIAGEYWQNSTPSDQRLWIAPEIYTPPTLADYRAGRDQALDAILSCAPSL